MWQAHLKECQLGSTSVSHAANAWWPRSESHYGILRPCMVSFSRGANEITTGRLLEKNCVLYITSLCLHHYIIVCTRPAALPYFKETVWRHPRNRRTEQTHPTRDSNVSGARSHHLSFWHHLQNFPKLKRQNGRPLFTLFCFHCRLSLRTRRSRTHLICIQKRLL